MMKYQNFEKKFEKKCKKQKAKLVLNVRLTKPDDTVKLSSM